MSGDLEITAMQDEYFVAWRHKRRWTIVEEPSGLFSVHEHTPNGVAPPCEYETKEEAAARVMQLMDIKEPVTPQNWPESVCIGYVDTDDHKRHEL
jgi:hypothetical protein